MFAQLSTPCCFRHLFVVFFLTWCLFILKSFYDFLCVLCEPLENITNTVNERLCKKINYLALVSESKKTLENSARMIRADAEAGKRLI